MIRKYSNPLLTGADCMIEDSFIPAMDYFCSLLQKYALKAYIVSSFRENTDVQGAIVSPAKMSNHLVGHALDVNFIDDKGTFWNSKDMINCQDMLEFITDWTGEGYRWGGHFEVPDDVHFDDGINIENPTLWTTIYNQIHQGQPSL